MRTRQELPGKKGWQLILAAAAFVIAPSLCIAKPAFPYHYQAQQNIDRHQIGYLDVVVDGGGHGVVTTKFSNGQQIRGNTFASATGFYAHNGKPFLIVVETKGLDGSLGGHAREGTVSRPVQLSPEQLKAFDHARLIGMRALCNGIDFKCMSISKIQKWIGPVIKMVEVIYAGWSP